MSIAAFYRQQAEREFGAAEQTDLENVRERHSRAAAAWTKLAQQIEHTDALRSARQTDQLVTHSLRASVDE